MQTSPGLKTGSPGRLFFFRRRSATAPLGTHQPRIHPANFSVKSLIMSLLLTAALFLGYSPTAQATHWRYGTISWRPIATTAATGQTTVEFKISMSLRYGFFGAPALGSSVSPGFPLYFGDFSTAGRANVVDPSVTITSINLPEDYLIAEATVTHTYSTTGNYTAYLSQCCRLSYLQNNHDNDFYLKTIVNIGTGNSSPVTSLVPIVNLATGLSNATFQLSANDPNGSPLSFSLATASDLGGYSAPTRPSSPNPIDAFVQPAGLSISPSGLVTFNTVGKPTSATFAGSPEPELYNSVVKISDGTSLILVDFLIKIVPNVGSPPAFVYGGITPANGSTIQSPVGTPITFTVQATDPDVGDVVSLQGSALPVGATFPPVSGTTTASGTFSFTPTSAGTSVITFTAEDAIGHQTLTSVTIQVCSPITPTLSASNNGVLTCANTSLTLTASGNGGTQYVFLGPGNLNQSGTANTAMVSQLGNYTVVVSGNNSCPTSVTTTVSSNTTVSPSLTTSGPITCTNPAATLTAGGGGTYVFSAGATQLNGGNTATVTQEGTYTVTVTGSNGCTSFTTTTVSSNTTAPSPTLTNNGPITCSNPTATLTAGGGDTYNFSSGATQQQGAATATVSQAGSYTVTATNTTNGCSSFTTTTVSSNTIAPQGITLINNGPLTCSQSSVLLTAGSSTTGVSYSFSGPGSLTSNGSTAAVSTAGVYSVTVVGSNGCSATASTTVVGDVSVPTAELSNNGPLSCSTTSVTLTARGGDAQQSFSYLFSGPGIVSQDPENGLALVNASGVYSVTVTNTETGCFSMTTTTVSSATTTPSVSIIPSSATLTCASPSVSLTAVGVGNVLWSTGSTASVISVNTANTYSVTLTNGNGCMATASVVVSQDQATPSVSISPSSATLTCASPSVSLTAVGTGTVHWDDNSTNAIRTVSASGTYSVTLTSTNGCVASANVVIGQDNTAPSVSISPSSATLTCASPSVSLTAIGTGTVRWSTNETSPTITVNTANIYSVTLTSTNGCVASTSIVIGQDNTTPSVSITPSSATLTCASPSVSLTAVGTGTVHWSTNETTPTITVNTANTYSVTLTSTNGCMASTNVVIGQDNTAPLVSITPSSATLTCASPSVSLTAVGTGTVHWSTNETTPTITVNTANTYSVTLTNGNGCMATASVVISQDNTAPSVSIMPSSATLTCASPSVSLTAVGTGSVHWSTNETSPTITVNTANTYSVTLTNGNGCMATASVVVSQDNTAPSVSISPSSATLTCASPSVSLTAVGTGSVLWSTGETTPTITVYAANTYSITLTSANGCTATTQTTVFSSTSLVAPILTASALSTSNQPISVTATGCTGGTINWTLLGGSGSADGPIYTLSQPGSYTLSATCSIGQCTSSPSQALSLQIQAGGPFRLVAPTYDCASGAITFNTLGGDGTLIQYFAIGITPWTTQANQTIEAGLRGDPKVILLQAQQSGVMVSYSFDLPAFCSGLQPPPPPIPNQPPVVNTTIATQTATLGSAYTFSLPAGTFTDPESQTLAYSALGLPAGLTLVGTTLSGTPTAEGFTTVTIIAQDPGGLTANTSFGLSVLPLNPQPPTGGGLTLLTPLYNCESGAITFRTSGGDGSPVEYFAIGVTGWTTQANQTVEAGLRADPKVLTLHARQNGVEAATLDFDMKAYCSGPPVNQPPVVNAPIANQQVVVNSAYSFTISGGTFTDPEGGPLTYSISGLPASLSATGSTISGVPSQTGVSTVTVTVIDNGGLTASTSFQLRVTPINVPPPVSTTLVLVAPTYNCASGAITFNTQGGDGSLIEYMAIGVTGWTSNPNQYVDQGLRTATDAGPLTLLARQSGVVVSYSFNLVAYCSGGARQASSEELPMRVVVLGNPVVNDRVRFEVRGAEGQPLRVSLISGSGKLVSEQGIERAGAIEIQTLEVGPQWAGVLLLRVSSPTQSQVVKVLKGE